MIKNELDIQLELIDVINCPDRRQTPIKGFATIGYLRALSFVVIDESCFQISLWKWGYHYKRRCKKPSYCFKADTTGIENFFNSRLFPRYWVMEVSDEGTYIRVTFMKVDEVWKKLLTS